MATKKSSAKKTAGPAKKIPAKRGGSRRGSASHAMPKEGKDPRGGLTAKGREYFNKKEGSHLRPGVQGPADTPEKMVRKGSFLRRHFAHPRGPMKDAKGEPTRLALSAHAWGEPVPNTMADAKKIAEKGHKLLEQYHRIKGNGEKASKKRMPAKKTTGLKTAPKKASAKGAISGGALKKTAAKKAVAKRADAKRSSSKRAANSRSKSSQTPGPARGS